jgi:hypothetical protein
MVKTDNPICQTKDRYFSPRPKKNILTQEYLKKMAEKPEKPHIKRIQIESSFASGPNVIKVERKIKGIKMNPKKRKNQCSMSLPTIYRNQKHISLNSYYKNFYLDTFNSMKETSNDFSIKKLVSQIIVINKKF